LDFDVLVGCDGYEIDFFQMNKASEPYDYPLLLPYFDKISEKSKDMHNSKFPLHKNKRKQSINFIR
jgi:hypothetical protein